MEIVKSKTERPELEEYKNLIFQKERLIKEGLKWEQEYYKEFGNLIKQSFELKVECIILKKQISFCQSKVNKNENIYRKSLEDYLSFYKEKYQNELDDLTSTINNAKKEGLPVPESDYQEIKKIYRNIVKKIHPDLHSDPFERFDIRTLWNQVEEAYFANDLERLKTLDFLVSMAVNDDIENLDIPDIKSRIVDLRIQVKEILRTKPYTFKNIMCYPEERIKVEEQLEKEIDDYKVYKAKLEEMLSKFNIEEWQ